MSGNSPERADIVERLRDCDRANAINHDAWRCPRDDLYAAAANEIERRDQRIAHLQADVSGFSFQHTLDQEEITRLRSVLKAAHESTDPRFVIEQAMRESAP